MRWVYLSPHLDDAVLSCGGMIWEQIQQGSRVEIWTVCAGNPPPGALSAYAAALHRRWQLKRSAAAGRRREDRAACRVLGARPRQLPIADCIYRRLPGGSPVVQSDSALFQPLDPGEAPLAASLAEMLSALLAPDDRLVSPLTLGGHMDHRLTRAAAETLARPLWFYADFPYIVLDKIDVARWVQPGWQAVPQPVSADGLAAWQNAITAYRSQVSTFWQDEAAMRAQMQAYWRGNLGASTLWAAPQPPSKTVNKRCVHFA